MTEPKHPRPLEQIRDELRLSRRELEAAIEGLRRRLEPTDRATEPVAGEARSAPGIDGIRELLRVNHAELQALIDS